MDRTEAGLPGPTEGAEDKSVTDAKTLAWAKNRVWFYGFGLPDGSVTATNTTQEVARLHEARRRAMVAVLDRRFGSRLSRIDAIDLASHEGWFSLDLAKRVRAVRGFDVNPESVAAARNMSELLRIENVSFEISDVRDIQTDEVQPASFVLLYGLLYHAEDPIRMLRIAAALTTDTLLIETQVAPWEFTGSVEWGSSESRKPVLGWFALIDDDDNREGGNTGLALVPSIEAIRQALLRLGFARADVVTDFNGDAEQMRRGQRAVIAGFR